MTIDAADTQAEDKVIYTPTHTAQVMGRRWAVAAGHPLAAGAAARILAAGGNAVDAGVAGGICLGVVHPDMVSTAGVAPILVHLAATRETHQVSGVGPYPRGASYEYFRDKCGGQLPKGLLRTVVPASPAAWLAALERWGTMSFADVIAPALECAERGYALSNFSAHQMAVNEAGFRAWPTSAAVFQPNGRPIRAGEVLVQRELGETFRAMIAAEKKAGGSRANGVRAARDHFYRGDPARAIAKFHAENGGLMTYEDLATFEVEVEAALRTTFREYEVACSGFWCQGPALLQALNLLEPYDLVRLGHNSPAYIHLLVEAIKLAFADRDAYYGDPLHVKVPADGLLSKAYADARRTLLREDRAWPEMPPAGDPYGLAAVRNGNGKHPVAGGKERSSLDTSYISVVDEQGNAFSATPSDPGLDSPIIPGVGAVVSPRGSQGWLDPEHPSVVAPGKRPRLTPAPAMMLRDGRAVMPFGTPGGDVQQQAMLQVMMNVTQFGMPMQNAIEAPRVASRSFPDSFWPHAYAPGKLEAEGRIPGETLAALARLGHGVSAWPDWEWRAGAVCGIYIRPDGTRMCGADPRRGAPAIAS
jgi:gamma-glutamyltranspeptidase/glutathione hydrolase